MRGQDGDVADRRHAPSTRRRRSTSTAANEALLKGLFIKVGELDADAAARIVDAIVDWRDADDLRRPNGAEARRLPRRELKYTPANAPFETVGEFGARARRDAGDLRARVAQPHRLFAPGGHQPATASRDVLLALPNATAEVVDEYIAAREEALERTACRCRRSRRRRASGAGAVRSGGSARKRLLPDGVTFVREAVVRPIAGSAPRRSIVLAWRGRRPRLRGRRATPRRGLHLPTPTTMPADRDLASPAPALQRAATSRAGSGVAGFWRWWTARARPARARPDRAPRSRAGACVR